VPGHLLGRLEPAMVAGHTDCAGRVHERELRAQLRDLLQLPAPSP
jgi:hypothetical protein